MAKAIIIENTGSPSVLKFKTIKDTKPPKGMVLIKHTAIGINFIDVYYRNGSYSLPKLPAILGFEACGYVEEIGEGVEGITIGERYAYATAPMGSYCDTRIIDPQYLIAVPEGISDEQASSTLFKGLTAHYLLRRTFFVKPDDKILIHAAAGGVGQLLCSWARFLRATVIGTVGSEEKVETALKNGCHHVINYNTTDFAKEVNNITEGQGVAVVYDSIGKNTLLKSIECLSNFGLLVSFGQSSGMPDPIDLSVLSPKSLFITRPSLFNYKSDRMELILSANEIFELLKRNILACNINKYNFDNVIQAHQDLEERKTQGSSVLIV
ncbi:Quinone oxidoreductase 1 [Rickettsiales bacterium Ac37b]|nr:Quinone oxidoreductase 1 [Rickettsiales bacterium Ac37b]